MLTSTPHRLIRWTRCLIVAGSLALPVARLNAADPAPPTNALAPATKPVAPMIIPELNIGAGVKLSDVIDTVRDLTGTNIVVANSGALESLNAPVMHLKRVTVQQVLDLITKAIPDVTTEQADNGENPIYIIHVKSDTPVPPGGGFAGPMPPGIAPMAAPQLDPNHQFVAVFPLRDIVDQQMRLQGKPDAKAALDAVLSLLQAAMDQANAGDKASLRVHEATQTLVFKGTAEFQQVLMQTLDALRPTDDEKKQAARTAELDRRDQEMADKLAQQAAQSIDLRAQLVDRQKRMDELEAQLVRKEAEASQSNENKKQVEELRSQLEASAHEVEMLRDALAASKQASTQTVK